MGGLVVLRMDGAFLGGAGLSSLRGGALWSD